VPPFKVVIGTFLRLLLSPYCKFAMLLYFGLNYCNSIAILYQLIFSLLGRYNERSPGYI
jgi:hypothetical protein